MRERKPRKRQSIRTRQGKASAVAQAKGEQRAAVSPKGPRRSYRTGAAVPRESTDPLAALLRAAEKMHDDLRAAASESKRADITPLLQAITNWLDAGKPVGLLSEAASVQMLHQAISQERRWTRRMLGHILGAINVAHGRACYMGDEIRERQKLAGELG